MIWKMCRIAILGCVFYGIVVGIALLIVLLSSDPREPNQRFDVGSFVPSLECVRSPDALLSDKHIQRFSLALEDPALPALQYYHARDGAVLTYRLYQGIGTIACILIHGSASHGGIWHAAAKQLAQNPHIGTILVPNLRGHWHSGMARGDCSYIGQLSDDIEDLASALIPENISWVMGGFSGGGGVALRYAAKKRNRTPGSYLLVAPSLMPWTGVLRGGVGKGWTILALQRLIGLTILSFCGLHVLEALPVVRWNRPISLWTGNDTLSYSYRMLLSILPPIWMHTLHPVRIHVVAAECDSMMNSTVYVKEFGQEHVTLLSGVTHAMLVYDSRLIDLINTYGVVPLLENVTSMHVG